MIRLGERWLYVLCLREIHLRLNWRDRKYLLLIFTSLPVAREEFVRLLVHSSLGTLRETPNVI